MSKVALAALTELERLGLARACTENNAKLRGQVVVLTNGRAVHFTGADAWAIAFNVLKPGIQGEAG